MYSEQQGHVSAPPEASLPQEQVATAAVSDPADIPKTRHLSSRIPRLVPMPMPRASKTKLVVPSTTQRDDSAGSHVLSGLQDPQPQPDRRKSSMQQQQQKLRPSPVQQGKTMEIVVEQTKAGKVGHLLPPRHGLHSHKTRPVAIATASASKDVSYINTSSIRGGGGGGTTAPVVFTVKGVANQTEKPRWRF